MRYTKWKWGLEPFFPNHMVHQAFITCLVLVVFVLVVFFAPGIFMLPEQPADPMNTPEHIKPEWYFLPAYQILKLVPTSIFGDFAEPIGIGVQGLAVAILILLPFLDRSPERNVWQRPWLKWGSIAAVVLTVILGIWGKLS